MTDRLISDASYDYSTYPSYLAEVFKGNSLDRFATEEICSKTSAFCEYLLQQNELFNLTAIKTPEAAALLHFADSLTLSEFIPAGASLLDIGSGAGFPAIPLAIARPDVSITALDSTKKRVDFINSAAIMLNLTNITAICHRAEDVTGSSLRESFDIVTARAVASYAILFELCIPAVKVGGSFIAMKSKDVSRETSGLPRIVKQFSVSSPNYHHSDLSFNGENFERCIVSVKKLGATPSKYPRAYAAIKKKPLF